MAGSVGGLTGAIGDRGRRVKSLLGHRRVGRRAVVGSGVGLEIGEPSVEFIARAQASGTSNSLLGRGVNRV